MVYRLRVTDFYTDFVQGGFNGFLLQNETKQRCKNKTAKDCVNLAAASWEKYIFFCFSEG